MKPPSFDEPGYATGKQRQATEAKATEEPEGATEGQATEERSADEHPEGRVQCFCQLEAVRFVERRIGPNRGRSYFRCRKPTPYTCKFHQWSDGPETDKPRPTSAPTAPPTSKSSADTSGVYELPPNLKIPKAKFQAVPTDQYVFPAVPITAPTVPLTEEQVQKALDSGKAAAEKAVANAALSLTGYWGTTKHGHNRLKPANSLQEFQAHMEETDPVFKKLSYPEKLAAWKKYKEIQEALEIQRLRGTLGIMEPTIDLNSCALDAMERIPKLSKDVAKSILLFRSNTKHQQFTNWEHVLQVPSVGPSTLRQIRIFCKDPADTFRVNPESASPAMVVEKTMVTITPEVFLTMRTKPVPGEGWADTGCRRSVGGEQVHADWQKHLHTLGLKPLRIDTQEEFIFGNNATEWSDCAFRYPIIIDSKMKGTIDIARIPKPCPVLFSTDVLREWGGVMDLEKQVTILRKLDSTQPFKEGIPFINIFNVIRELDWETIPQEYWVDAQEAFYAE